MERIQDRIRTNATSGKDYLMFTWLKSLIRKRSPTTTLEHLLVMSDPRIKWKYSNEYTLIVSDLNDGSIKVRFMRKMLKPMKGQIHCMASIVFVRGIITRFVMNNDCPCHLSEASVTNLAHEAMLSHLGKQNKG